MPSAKGLELFLCSPLGLDLSAIKRALAPMGIRVTEVRDQDQAVSVCNANAGPGSRKSRRFRHVLLIDEAFGDGRSGGLGLLGRLRGQLRLPWPVIVTSFQNLGCLRKRLPLSPLSGEPMVRFGQGTYYLQLPFLLPALIQLLQEAQSVNSREMGLIAGEFRVKEAVDKVDGFVHRSKSLLGLSTYNLPSYLENPGKENWNSLYASLKSKNTWRRVKSDLDALFRSLRMLRFKPASNYPELIKVREALTALRSFVGSLPIDHGPACKRKVKKIQRILLKLETIGKHMKKRGYAPRLRGRAYG